MKNYKRLVAPFLCLLAGCATQAPTVTIPDKLRGSPRETLAMVVPAKGVQIYECRPRREQVGAFEWSFVAPEADLFDRHGAKIGKHYAGPHWESSDGSGMAPKDGCSPSSSGARARVDYSADYYFLTTK